MADDITGGYTGYDAYEYLNLGTKAAPAYSRLKRLEDVSHPDERGNVQSKQKGREDEVTLLGHRKRGVAFKYKPKRATDPILAAMLAAYEGKECVHYAATDRPIAESGARGFEGPYVVTKFSEDRPFEGEVTYDIELKPADAEDPENAGSDWEIEPILTP